MSRDLPLLYTVRIILRLRALRTSLGLSACPPRPPVNADENFLGLSIYPGSMTEVTSQDDLHFGSLGRLFFIIETRLNGDVVRKRAVFDIARIPRRILETDQELNELLVSRNNSINASSSSPPRSTAVSADTEAIASASPSNEFPVQDTTLDDEHDASEPHFPSRRVQPSGRAERRHAPYCMSHRLDRSQPSQDAHEHQMSMGITVTILAWTKESYRQTTATLAVGNGHCMTLSLVTRALNELFDGRADSSHLERQRWQYHLS
ncbi:hypothetical protein EV361DRAFT_967670 [Lentinula raphanica]|nr:hypothetical protein EV361DRAFT_967670 [Lentinula raphanica]